MMELFSYADEGGRERESERWRRGGFRERNEKNEEEKVLVKGVGGSGKRRGRLWLRELKEKGRERKGRRDFREG